MACQHLDEKGRFTRCRAVEGTLIPSHFEREKYCRVDGAGGCPTEKLYRLGGAPISEELYYRLWLAPTDDCHEPAQPQRDKSAAVAHREFTAG